LQCTEGGYIIVDLLHATGTTLMVVSHPWHLSYSLFLIMGQLIHLFVRVAGENFGGKRFCSARKEVT
jgi:hypothetical protein